MGSHHSIPRLARTSRQKQQQQQQQQQQQILQPSPVQQQNEPYPNIASTSPTSPTSLQISPYENTNLSSSSSSTPNLPPRRPTSRLQKPPEKLSSRRISLLDFNLRRRTADGSITSFESAPLPSPIAIPSTAASEAGHDEPTILNRRRSTYSHYRGTSESGIDEYMDIPVTEVDMTKLLRRKSLLVAAPPGTVTRKPPPRSRRYTMPEMAHSEVPEELGLVLERIETETREREDGDGGYRRCMTPSGISVIGAFKRGSLRITNGAASPCPSSAPTSPGLKAARVGFGNEEDVAVLELEGEEGRWEGECEVVEDEGGLRIMVEEEGVDVYLERPPSRLPPLPPVHKVRPATPSGNSYSASNDTPKSTTSSASSTTIRDFDEFPTTSFDNVDPDQTTKSYPHISVHYYKPPPPFPDSRRLIEARPNRTPPDTQPPPPQNDTRNFYPPPPPPPFQEGEEIYTFEQKVITRRRISREFIRADIREQEIIASDYTVSSTRVMVRRPAGLSKSFVDLPTVKSWEVPVQEKEKECKGKGGMGYGGKREGKGGMEYVKVSTGIPVDSKITGQSYYRRFERKRSGMVGKGGD